MLSEISTQTERGDSTTFLSGRLKDPGRFWIGSGREKFVTAGTTTILTTERRGVLSDRGEDDLLSPYCPTSRYTIGKSLMEVNFIFNYKVELPYWEITTLKSVVNVSSDSFSLAELENVVRHKSGGVRCSPVTGNKILVFWLGQFSVSSGQLHPRSSESEPYSKCECVVTFN